MIKFFRKIRQRLLLENKYSKYLFYALGEIVLIVIGILIALQINNWNITNKTKILEIKTLKELRSDLIQNISDIDINLDRLEETMHANELIIYHIENNLPYNDSLAFYFSKLYPYIVFSPIQTTYNNLKQTGMSLISSESLRANISDLYATQFYAYSIFESTYLVEHYENYIKPMYMTEFETFEYDSLIPKKYSRFIKNQYYRQIMNFTITYCNMFILFQSRLKENTEKLIQEVDKEIEYKNNKG